MKNKKEIAAFKTLLTQLGACSEAVEFTEGKTLAQAWKTSARGDWMLWLLGKMADKPGWPTRQQIVLAACDCASLALKYVPKGEERPRLAIETARAWAKGNATIEQVREARRVAYAAYSAAYAAAYAADATYSAAYAAAYAAAAYAAAAADAAYAAAAADAADADARKTTLKKCASIVRKLKVPARLA